MRIDNAFVAVDAVQRDAQPFEFGVQPETGAGTGIAVDETEAGLGQVRCASDSLRVARCYDQSLRAIGQCDHVHRAVWEKMTDEGRVVLAGLIQQVRAGNLAQPLAQVDEPVQAADGQGQQGEMVGDLLADLFERQIVAAGEDDGRFVPSGRINSCTRKAPALAR